MPKLSASKLLLLAAVIVFALGAAGVSIAGIPAVPLGLAFMAAAGVVA